jgi:hypothetical protein
MKTRPYTPPPGYYDLPYTYAFNAGNLTNGNNYQNQQIYIQGGYGDFAARRIVGLNRILNPNPTGQFQVMRASQGVYQSSNPVQSANSPELAIAPEEWYPETGQIGFDLYGVLLPSNPIAAQIAFQGVRRLKGAGASHRPSYKFQPKSYTYVADVTLPSQSIGFVSSYTKVDNYDFELYQVLLFSKNSSGLFVVIKSPVCAITIYDQFTVGISNIPVVDIYLNGAPGTPYENGAIVPPLFYKKDSQIQIDYHGFGTGALTQTQELLSTGPASTDYGQFVAVAAAGNYAAAYDRTNTGSEIGQVDIYQNINGVWTFLQALNKPAASGVDSYGTAIAFSPDGTKLFVGEPSTAATRGSVYVYNLAAGSFSLAQTIQGTDGAVTDFFGAFIAISPSGNLLIGATRSTSGAVGQPGNVYYYTLVAGTWTLQQKFNAADTTAGFGLNIYSGGNWMIVTGNAAGGTRAYFFQLVAGAWVQEQEISPPAGFTFSGYGGYMTSTGLTAVIGAIATGGFGPEEALVYKLAGGVWTLQQTLLHPFAGLGAEFFAAPNSIAGDDSTLIIGAYQAPFSGSTAGNGQVYVYTLTGNTWALSQTLIPDPAFPTQAMGIAVSGSPTGGWVFVGNEPIHGSGLNPVYVFEAGPAQVVAYLVGRKLYPCE